MDLSRDQTLGRVALPGTPSGAFHDEGNRMIRPQTATEESIRSPKSDHNGTGNRARFNSKGDTVEISDALISPRDEEQITGAEDDTPAQGTPPVESH
jgi:hypothetical protein